VVHRHASTPATPYRCERSASQRGHTQKALRTAEEAVLTHDLEPLLRPIEAQRERCPPVRGRLVKGTISYRNRAVFTPEDGRMQV